MQIAERVKAVQVTALAMDPPVVVDAATPLRDVIRRMRDDGSGCALVTRDGRLAGIFTERDLVARVLGTEAAMEQPVAEWMTADPDRVAETDSVRKAIRQMRRGGFRNVPVVDEAGGVVGCVRHKDIVNYLAEHYPEHVLNLPPDPEQAVSGGMGGRFS